MLVFNLEEYGDSANKSREDLYASDPIVVNDDKVDLIKLNSEYRRGEVKSDEYMESLEDLDNLINSIENYSGLSERSSKIIDNQLKLINKRLGQKHTSIYSSSMENYEIPHYFKTKLSLEESKGDDDRGILGRIWDAIVSFFKWLVGLWTKFWDWIRGKKKTADQIHEQLGNVILSFKNKKLKYKKKDQYKDKLTVFYKKYNTKGALGDYTDLDKEWTLEEYNSFLSNLIESTINDAKDKSKASTRLWIHMRDDIDIEDNDLDNFVKVMNMNHDNGSNFIKIQNKDKFYEALKIPKPNDKEIEALKNHNFIDEVYSTHVLPTGILIYSYPKTKAKVKKEDNNEYYCYLKQASKNLSLKNENTTPIEKFLPDDPEQQYREILDNVFELNASYLSFIDVRKGGFETLLDTIKTSIKKCEEKQKKDSDDENAKDQAVSYFRLLKMITSIVTDYNNSISTILTLLTNFTVDLINITKYTIKAVDKSEKDDNSDNDDKS